ncbi:hypothetical protein Tco_0531497 [Tanacetum coccineum]
MKCRSPVLWAEIGESSLTGPELVLDMTDKVVLIKEKLKAARDRQKSYADNRRKPLEFEVGDRVMLKVSPWKGVIRFGKKGKLAPRYVGPFEILERVGPVAYRLRLPEELSGIKVDKTLRFVEEPVENSDREVKRLKCSRMVVVKAKWLAVRYLVKVSWNSKCNFELTWVWEDYLKDKLDNQSIERDRLNGIGFVLDFVEFISFTFGDKEMISVIEALCVLDRMSTPTQCCDMGSDGYAYPVYDMFGIVDPNMQNELIESLFWDIVVCRKPMILAQLYVDVLSIIFRSGVEGVILCLRVLSLRCLLVKGAYGYILGLIHLCTFDYMEIFVLGLSMWHAKQIIAVTILTIMKKYDYGNSEGFEVPDGTLNDVRTALYDIASGIRIEYLPKRKWSGLDKQRARVMIQDIKKQLFQRRLCGIWKSSLVEKNTRMTSGCCRTI